MSDGFNVDHTVVLSDHRGQAVHVTYRTYREEDGSESQPIHTFFARLYHGFDWIPDEMRRRLVLAWRGAAYVDIMDIDRALDCFNVYDYETGTVTFLPANRTVTPGEAAEAFGRWVLRQTADDAERITETFRYADAS